MALNLKEVRVPTPRVRAERLLAALEAHGPLNEYNAAGAISPDDGVAILRATEAGMAMTLANGSITGETMIVKCVEIDSAGDTAVLTPASLAGGTTLTFDAAGEFATLIWDGVGAAWAVRGGNTATLA